MEDHNLIFPNCYREEVDALLLPYSIVMKYPANHMFLSPGENSGYIYYVKSGQTKHYMLNSDSLEKVLYCLRPGWFFNEVNWLLGHPTGIYSKTEKESEIYCVDGKACRSLMTESEMFRDFFLHGCCHKILVMRYEIENLSFNTCKDRIKRLLISSVSHVCNSDSEWLDLKVRYTHQEIGGIVGSTRVTVSRLMNELCGEGFIRVINRTTQVNVRQYRAYISQNDYF